MHYMYDNNVQKPVKSLTTARRYLILGGWAVFEKKWYAGSYYSVFANVATKHLLGGVFGVRPNIDSTEVGLFQNGLIYDILGGVFRF